jgi:thymidylate synthase
VKEDTRWEYTYHQRLFAYSVPNMPKVFDQINLLIEKLAKIPHTRRAQAITWKVWEDNDCYDPACLQSIWCRIIPMDDQGILNMNVRFRSNDAYKAAFMNMFALIQLQIHISKRISEIMGKTIIPGRYYHQADSYHLYGHYHQEFEQRFLTALKNRSFEERTFRYEDVRDIMIQSIPDIRKKAAAMIA